MLLRRRGFCSSAMTAGLTLGSFGALGSMGCGSSGGRRVSTPKGGVRLRYDLTAGASFDGHLRVGSTRALEGLAEHINQNVECDARLLSMGVDTELGGHLMRATVRNVDLDWTVPPDAGLSRDDFVKVASEQLRSLDLRFVLSDRGQLLVAPVPPPSMPGALGDLFEAIAMAVTLGFVELPTGQVPRGHTWVEQSAQGLAAQGKTDAHFDGLIESPPQENPLAAIELAYVTSRPVETEAGPRRAQLEGETRVLLAREGFAAKIEASARDFHPGRGLAILSIHGTWSRVDKGSEDATAVQVIDDPCDADYVGEERCAEPLPVVPPSQ